LQSLDFIGVNSSLGICPDSNLIEIICAPPLQRDDFFDRSEVNMKYIAVKREHNECSLDVDPGFEPDVMFPPLTPEEIILDEENRSVLYAALDRLPPIQARRVYAHYILGKKKSEIARAENVVESSICSSIRRGLKNLCEILKNFYR
jgi:RNA polymerase sigma-70 factor (ECF subfamily)